MFYYKRERVSLYPTKPTLDNGSDSDNFTQVSEKPTIFFWLIIHISPQNSGPGNWGGRCYGQENMVTAVLATSASARGKHK